jgi:hypothetical protein
MFSPCSAKRRASDKDLPVAVAFGPIFMDVSHTLDSAIYE